jgi:hypothetical protein
MLRWAKSELNKMYSSRLPLERFTYLMAERGTEVITSNMITTFDFRGDQSRFFVKVDSENIVIGGDFG